MTILLFEDTRVEALRPITLTRPACLISCAGFTLVEALQHLEPKAKIVVQPRAELANTTLQLLPDSKPSRRAGKELRLNARLVPHLPSLRKLLAGKLKNAPLFEHPWDAVKYNLEYTRDNLTELAKTGYTEIQPGVFAKPSTVVKEFVSFNTETGPIILDENVTIENFVAMRGPIRVRKNSTILEHSVIVGPTTIGEHCKIRGEVMESIFENYSNKQHYGHIGHSYIGSWVNMGAGTTNSDLKNTYGTIRVDDGKNRIETGMQFLGCIMGDHVKTSINTSIATGKIIGTGAHLEGTIRDNIPPFTSTYNNVHERIPIDVTLKIMKRSMARRNVTMTDADRKLIEHAHAETADERTSLTNDAER